MYGNSYQKSMYQLLGEFQKWAALMPYGNSEVATAEGKVFQHCASLLEDAIKRKIPLFENPEEWERFIEIYETL